MWRCGIARLFTNGAEEGTATLSNGHWSGSGGTPTAVTTHPRSGSYEYRFDPGEALLRQLYFANSDRIMYARAYLYPDSYPTTDSAIMRIVLSGGDDWVVMLSTTGTLYLALKIIGVFVQQGAATAAIGTGSYVGYVEFKADTINNVMGFRWNGTEISGDQAIAGGQTFGASGNEPTFGLDVASIGHGGLLFMDDIAINDDQGSFQNSWPGAAEVINLRPNAAGDNAGWAIITGEASNYQAVDEVTPDDATSYVQGDPVNETDDHNVDAVPAAMESTDTISLVEVHTRFAGVGVDSNLFLPRIKMSSGGTVEEGTAHAPTSATWFTNAKTEARLAKLRIYDMPGASTTAITPADLGTMQIGYRISLEVDVNQTNISAVYATVEHVPAAAAARQPRPGFVQGSQASGWY